MLALVSITQPRSALRLIKDLPACVTLFADDNCPQRFNDGIDPYSTELKIFVLGGATCSMGSLTLSLVSVLITIFIRH